VRQTALERSAPALRCLFTSLRPSDVCRFYTRDAGLTRCWPCMGLCLLRVCHKSELCRTGWTEPAGLWR